MNTDTPKTDELYEKVWLFSSEQEADESLCAMRDHARELERENARLLAYVQALEDQCDSGQLEQAQFRVPNPQAEPRA